MTSFADRFPPGGFRPALDGGAVQGPTPPKRRLRWADLTGHQAAAIVTWVATDCVDGVTVLQHMLHQEGLFTGSESHRALADVRAELQHGILHLLATTLSSLDLDMIGRVADEGGPEIERVLDDIEKARQASVPLDPPVNGFYVVGGAASTIKDCRVTNGTSRTPPTPPTQWDPLTDSVAPRADTPRSNVTCHEGTTENVIFHPYQPTSHLLQRPYRVIGYENGKAMLIGGFTTEHVGHFALGVFGKQHPEMTWVLTTGAHDGSRELGRVEPMTAAEAHRIREATGEPAPARPRTDGVSSRPEWKHPTAGDYFLGRIGCVDHYLRRSEANGFLLLTRYAGGDDLHSRSFFAAEAFDGSWATSTMSWQLESWAAILRPFTQSARAVFGRKDGVKDMVLERGPAHAPITPSTGGRFLGSYVGESPSRRRSDVYYDDSAAAVLVRHVHSQDDVGCLLLDDLRRSPGHFSDDLVALLRAWGLL